MLALLIGLLVFVSAVCLDYALTCHQLAVKDLSAKRAGCWSAFAYVASAPGFVFAIKVSLWLMIPEIVGLFLGSYLAVKMRYWNLKRLARKSTQ